MRIRLLAACLTLPLMACEVGAPEAWREPEAGDTFLSSTQDIQEALGALPGVEVLGTHEDGVPLMIRGPLGTVDRSVHSAGLQEVHAQASAALARVAPVFRLRTSDLVPLRLVRDELGFTHLRYEQRRNGLPVVGHELLLHIDAEGRVYAANGSARGGEDALAPSQAKVTAESALATALGATPGGLSTEGAPRLVYVRSNADQRLKLAFELVVLGALGEWPIRDHVFIDAGDGGVVERFSDIHDARSRRVYSANYTTVLPGTLKRSEGQAATGDTVVDKAYDNLGIFYDCNSSLFGVDSYDGAGGLLKASVHYSTNYVNAYMSSGILVCGDGDGVQSGPLCNDSDVVVHEFTHEITSRTSGLLYSGQSGGLNESFSDIFAAACESWTRGFVLPDADVWKIGEDIWTPATWGDALRYLSDPKRGPQLECYADYTSGASTYQGAGIPSLAFSLLATGGTHPRARTALLVTGIGVEKAAKIFNRANRIYMTSSSTFASAKTATEAAAMDLYGSVTKTSVTQAWQAVGVGVSTSPVCLPTATALSNGVAVGSLSGASGAWTSYVIDVPPCAGDLKVELSGGSGNADLYVKALSGPALSSFDCRPLLAGNTETCTFATPSPGSYYIALRGTAAYSGVTLKASFTAANVIPAPTTLAGISGALDSQQVWSYSAAPGKTVQARIMSGFSSTGNADLYVQFGTRPSLATYDCRPYALGNDEFCSETHAAPGTYCIMLHGHTDYTNVSLKLEEM